MRQKTVDFFLLRDTSVGFNSRNNLANLGSLAKVSVPLQSTILGATKFTLADSRASQQTGQSIVQCKHDMDN